MGKLNKDKRAYRYFSVCSFFIYIGDTMQIIDAVLRLKDNFTNVIQKATKSIDEHRSQQLRTAKSIQQTGAAISNLGAKMSILSAPILAAAMAGAKLNSDLTTGLAKVSTLVDTNIVDMQKMRSELIALSNETGVSVTELTEGVYQAISASVDANKATEFMRISALGAKAGFTDMTTATDALTTILNAYGFETEKAIYMMDRLIVTQNLGKTTVDEIGKSIGQVIPTAASAGMQIDELLSSVASLTASGMQTSAAMTGVKAALSNIIKPAESAAKLAAELGLQFNQAHLAEVGWAKFLEEIKTATNNDIEMMGKLFGSTEALNVILSLTGNGANKFKESLDAMANSTGATDEAIKKLDATPAAQLAKATNELKNAGMELAQGLMPLVSRTATLTKAFASWLKNLSPLQKELLFGLAQFIVIGGVALSVIGKGISLFGGFYGSIVKASTAINKAGSVTGALANKFPFLKMVFNTLLTGFTKFSGFVSILKGNFVSALTTIGKAIIGLRNPFLALRALFATNPIGLALLALTFIIPFVISHFNEFRYIIEKVFNHLQETITVAINKIQPKIEPVIKNLNFLIMRLGNAWDAIMTSLTGKTMDSGTAIAKTLEDLGKIFMFVFDYMIFSITTFITIFADVFSTCIMIASDLIAFIKNVFLGNWSAAWNNITDIFIHAFDGIKNVFTDVMSMLSSGLDYILGRTNETTNAVANINNVNADYIPQHAIGTNFFAGGKTWIHEKGAEIVDLPQGTRIIPHDESLRQQYKKGYEKGISQKQQTQSITIAKLADSIVVREQADIDRFAEQLAFRIQQNAINNMIGAV